MAIIIPSKNIYEKENNKIRDNLVDKLQVSIKELGSTYQEETQVYSKKLYGEDLSSSYGNERQDFQYSCIPKESDKSKSDIAFTYVSAKPFYYTNIYFSIPTSFGTSYIQTIKDLTNENGENNIQCNVFGKTIEKEAKITISYEVNDGVMTANITKIEVSDIGTESPTSQINLPVEVVATTDKNASGEKLVSKIEIKDIDGTINKTKLTLNTDLDAWVFDDYVSVLSGLETITMYYPYAYVNTSYAYGEIIVTGKYIKYEPKNINLLFNGNILGINIEDKTITLASGSKHPFSIEGNELLQFDSNSVATLFGKTLTSYQNGKETATILCSISDYYDESGNKVISISDSDSDKEMVFRMYDEVIPMVYGSDGKDRPMSKYNNGTAKKFRVLGVEPIYDGAVWQKLTLQEI